LRSPYRAYHFRLQRYETPGLRATWSISGLNTFTCVAADFLLPSGFIKPVTGLHAEFRTELVVNLYSGWIAQLADASFPGTLIVFLLMISVYKNAQQVQSIPQLLLEPATCWV
jgi:hypothetical protein